MQQENLICLPHYLGAWHTVVENPNNEGDDISNSLVTTVWADRGSSLGRGRTFSSHTVASGWIQSHPNSYRGTVMQDKIYLCVALITYHNTSSTAEMHPYTPW